MRMHAAALWFAALAAAATVEVPAAPRAFADGDDPTVL